ncbi:MAG: glycosyltransferase [Candidatus Omnitrophica bacterium]|nr:glycosyltransferase [Candidatus Omnitrophota bacterium]
MSEKRILLMHISKVSGHRQAALAITKALEELGQGIKVRNIDAFNYANPRLEKLVNRLYMGVIKGMPRLWDYLYDNQEVYKRVEQMRTIIYRYSEKKIKELFDNFQPDVVVCTQAFPCGMVADYKQRYKVDIPLVGILTDYAPHMYWLNDRVNIYVVPSLEIKQRLKEKRIPEERLRVLGIPIDPDFQKPINREENFRNFGLNAEEPVILLMGGGQGLGPIKQIARALEQLSLAIQLIVVCGTNRTLYRWFRKNKANFTKPILLMGYTQKIPELMELATLIISKPGGLSSTEALSKALPLVIVKPLPGQESQNTQVLLRNGAALKADNMRQLKSLIEKLLTDSAKIEQLRQKARTFAQADSAIKIAQLILKMIK